eukprot:ctg_2544.g678
MSAALPRSPASSAGSDTPTGAAPPTACAHPAACTHPPFRCSARAGSSPGPSSHQCARQPEIGHLDRRSAERQRLVQQQILRFEVAVHQAGRVQIRHAAGGVPRQRHQVSVLQPPPQVRADGGEHVAAETELGDDGQLGDARHRAHEQHDVVVAQFAQHVHLLAKIADDAVGALVHRDHLGGHHAGTPFGAIQLAERAAADAFAQRDLRKVDLPRLLRIAQFGLEHLNAVTGDIQIVLQLVQLLVQRLRRLAGAAPAAALTNEPAGAAARAGNGIDADVDDELELKIPTVPRSDGTPMS